MLSVIGDILPMAAVIAANPIIVVVMVLMLLSPGGVRTSAAYLSGWLAGLTALVGLVYLVSRLLVGEDGAGGLPTFVLIESAIGMALIYLGWKKFKGRPARGEIAELPSWMAAVSSMSPARSFGLGVMLATMNPKNIMLVASATVIMAASDLDTPGVAGVVVIFVAVATLSIGGPFVAALVAFDRVAPSLREVREWLVQNSATILAVLLFVIGVNILGKALGAL